MNILSLFDGISCGRVALDRLGVQVDRYFASEIDKYAIEVSKANYPDNYHIGDVSSVKYENNILTPSNTYRPTIGDDMDGSGYPVDIDLLIGGSPCQGFSQAGNQLNFDDPRSRLFFEYVRLLQQVKPKYFILENVRMNKESQDIISQQLGVQPVMINSCLLSAQNRVRLYWVGELNHDGSYSQVAIPQPIDKALQLLDILDVDFDRLQHLGVYRDSIVVNSKSQTILATLYKENAKSMVKRNKRGLLVGFPSRQVASLTQQDKREILGSDLLFESDGVLWRKLTPLECVRLQTLPDAYVDCISNTQRYKTLGNGWTVDVIAHILSYLIGVRNDSN